MWLIPEYSGTSSRYGPPAGATEHFHGVVLDALSVSLIDQTLSGLSC